MRRARRAWCSAGLALILLGGCAQRGPAPLYLWEDFPKQQYGVLLHEGASPDEQIRDLEAHAEKAAAAQAALPPGLRAHLGLLYLNAGDADRARTLWMAEKAAFAESAPYMDRLLQRLDASASAAKVENPS